MRNMILNTGQRTDIPAFYPKWLANRLKEGFVCVRNPFNPVQVSRYRLDPEVVDIIGFCTKNPSPFFPYMGLLEGYGQFWYVTITPYGKDVERNMKAHNPDSPFLIGNYTPDDEVSVVVQKSWIDHQISLFDSF